MARLLRSAGNLWLTGRNGQEAPFPKIREEAFLSRRCYAALAATSRTNVISDGAPSLFGGPQYPVPRLV